jgi:hypothetical protein
MLCGTHRPYWRVPAVLILSHCVCLVVQRNGPSIFMFGFMSLVFTMRERVESSMEMVRHMLTCTL